MNVERLQRSALRAAAAWTFVFIAALDVGAEASRAQTRDRREGGSSAKEIDRYCADVAASVEAIRLERKQKQLVELETQLSARVAELQSKQGELRAALDRLDAFEKKSNEALVALYARMKPDAAAAQLAELEDDAAAALMLQLKPKISSAILGEMEPGRGAALIRKISQIRAAISGKKP